MVAMSDGTALYTEIFLPPGPPKPRPVVLLRSPYPYSLPSRHDKMAIPRYLTAGYAFVFQLTRGQGRSEGVFHHHSDDPDDGYDCIAWIAAQAWCDGNVGMQGVSYLGSSQLMAARRKPPALKCIMPTGFVGNFTRCFPFSHGVPHKAAYLQWYQLVDAHSLAELDAAYGDANLLSHPKWGPALRKRPLLDAANEVLSGDKLAAYRDSIARPLDDEFWAPIHFNDEQLAELDIPIFFTDGWYDATVGPMDFFSRLEKTKSCDSTSKPDRYLLVGPWNHAQTFTPGNPGDFDGERRLPENAALDLVALRLAFFDRYLKGQENTSVQADRVRVYISGGAASSVNRWFGFTTLPAPDTQWAHWYLHSDGQAHDSPSDGTLNNTLPGKEPTDHYLRKKRTGT